MPRLAGLIVWTLQMKDQQDHSIVTHWGGRAERYREFPRTLIRAHDTFGVLPVQFGHAFHFEAWVLERFAASTKSITTRPTIVSAVLNGVERSETATFVVTRRDDSVEYFHATKTESPTPPRGPQTRSSSPPNIHRPSMLNSRCVKPPCRKA